jgi:isoaspartyl peptidase/L-asparaginase-like protein (Ntn-hydrolase superfamily)
VRQLERALKDEKENALRTSRAMEDGRAIDVDRARVAEAERDGAGRRATDAAVTPSRRDAANASGSRLAVAPGAGVAMSSAASNAPLSIGTSGTVGAVALDRFGNLAAATSTGGLTAKRAGRIGDSPIIGAGTYASNKSCAVSATGTGEYFIRLTVAREICSLVELKGMKLQAAADEVIQKQLTALQGDGGIIAVAPDGQMAWSFNTSGMYRARMSKDQPVLIAIYKDEK